MIIGLTGTPGTGKTTTADKLPYRVLHLNQFIRERKLYEEYDPERDTHVVDEDLLAREAGEAARDMEESEDVVVVEGHLAHYLPADLVIVLRANPKTIMKRLEERGYSESKVRENAEAEALDAILIEALEENDNVQEIDTTHKTPGEVAGAIEDIIEGRAKHPYGRVDWTGFLEEVLM